MVVAPDEGLQTKKPGPSRVTKVHNFDSQLKHCFVTRLRTLDF